MAAAANRDVLGEVYQTLCKLFLDNAVPTEGDQRIASASTLDNVVSIATEIAKKYEAQNCPQEPEFQESDDVGRRVYRTQEAFSLNDLANIGSRILSGNLDTGNATIDMLLNTLLKYAKAFGKVRIFQAIMELLRTRRDELLRNKWIQMFAAMLIAQAGPNLFGIIINFFAGNRHDSGVLGLLQDVLQRLRKHGGDQIAGCLTALLSLCNLGAAQQDVVGSLIDKLRSNPDDPEVERGLRNVLMENLDRHKTEAAAN